MKEEQFDLTDQLRRASKAVPRLIAEGYSKKHYRHVDPKLSDKLIETYDKTSRQIYNLAKSLRDFKER